MKKNFSILFSLILIGCAWNKNFFSFENGNTTAVEKNLGIDKKFTLKFQETSAVVMKKKKSLQGTTKSSSKGKRAKKYPRDYPKKYEKDVQRHSRIWKKASPVIYYGEETEIDIKYFGITAGKMVIKTMPDKFIGEKRAFHIRGKISSSPFYQSIYSINDTIETFSDAQTLLPLKYVLAQKESNKSIDHLQIFDHESLKTHYWYRKEKKGNVKRENKEIYMPPYFQDYFSFIQFLRWIPLEVGKRYEFPLMNKDKIWTLQVRAERRESIKVLGKKYNAIKVSASTKFSTAKKKKGDMKFWFSTDRMKRLLQFSADLKFGQIKGEIVRFRPGRAKSR